MKILLAGFLLICCYSVFPQAPDSMYVDYVKMPQLYPYGSQLSYPVITLNSADRLELHFDDINADVKQYYYTYQLCNADWTPAQLNTFDYIHGFLQMQITNYRFSSISLTKYTHYQAILPDVSCVPTRAGNYLVKVFLDSDTSKLVFTRRLLVLKEGGVSIAAQIFQPFNPQTSYTHQKLEINVNTKNLNILDPAQQLKVVVLQNRRWDVAIMAIRPTFYSGTNFQYNSDDGFIFQAGKQWRWLDIQSFRYQSDRVLRADYGKNATTIYVKPDLSRADANYYFYNDINGEYYIQTTESINPFFQADYATVRFTFATPDKQPFPDKDLYLVGQMTSYKLSDLTKMEYNAAAGVYEGSAFLKMGYYNYSYVTIDRNDPGRRPSFSFTEGNNFDAENDYTILVYYRELGGRADQLVGMVSLNSLNGNP